jgi:transcriptional regulator with XRE-family HTH domain
MPITPAVATEQESFTSSPQPYEDGPWGAAVRYWLEKLHISQAALARDTGIQPNTIGRIVRGLHAQTRLLELIAFSLKVPFESVLVSPRRHGPAEDRREFARRVIADALQVVDAAASVDEATLELAKRLQNLPPNVRRTLIRLIVQHENKPKRGARRHRARV